MNRTITVKGTGTVRAVPDMTVVTFTLRCTDPDYARAAEKADLQLAALRTAFAPLGFDKDALKSTDYRVSAEYEGVPDEHGVYRNVFRGYTCTHGLRLSFDSDAERLSSVLAAVAASVAEPDLQIRFLVKDPDSVRKQLLRDAAENARKSAEVLADACGVRLGTLLSVSCGVRDEEIVSGTTFSADAAGCMKARAAVYFAPEEAEITDTAVFVWEIE